MGGALFATFRAPGSSTVIPANAEIQAVKVFQMLVARRDSQTNSQHPLIFTSLTLKLTHGVTL